MPAKYVNFRPGSISGDRQNNDLSKDKCDGLQEDIRWVAKQIKIKGVNLRGYRIDFEGEGKRRAYDLIKQNVDDKNKSPEDDYLQNNRPF